MTKDLAILVRGPKVSRGFYLNTEEFIDAFAQNLISKLQTPAVVWYVRMVLCGNNCTLYPTLHVMGFQSSNSILSDAVCTCLIQIIMKDYITFPILLSNKNFKEMTDGARFILFKGFKSPFPYYERDVDLGMIDNDKKCSRVSYSSYCRGFRCLTHTLGTLVPVIGASGFATTTAATAIGIIIGSFR